MSIDRLATRSGGVIGTIGPISGSGVFSMKERYALTADNYEDVSLYLKMNGANSSTTFYDSSLYGHTVTANGNAQISTAQSKFGGASGYFDGSGDYLAVPDDASIQLGSSDFTIDGWFYSNVPSPSRQYHLFNINMDSAGTSYRAAGLAIRGDLSGQLRLSCNFIDVGSLTGVSIDSPSAFPVNSWQHVAVVRSGAAVTLFLDGSNVGSGSLPSAGTSLFAGTLNWIGNLSFSGTFTFNGYIDDLRITKGIARWTGNYTPPQREFRP